MATKEFKNKQEAVEAEVLGTNLPATTNDTAAMPGFGGVSGEVDAGDVRTPVLQFVYGVGDLSATFTPGSLVLNKSELLVEKGKPLHVTIMHIDMYWKEYLDNEAYNSGVKPRSFKTEAEVLANGGTVPLPDGSWPNNTPPTFAKAAVLQLLIEKPEGVLSGSFGLVIDGKDHAVARLYVDKTSYRATVPVILGATKYSLRKCGMPSGVFDLWTVSEKNKKGTVIIAPKMKLSGAHTEAFIKDMCLMLGVTMNTGEPELIAAPAATA